jgi:hypothetical protein
MPLVRRLLSQEVVEGKLTPVDAQDLASEIALRLLRRLQSAEPGEGAEPIDDLHDYVRVMVHNVLEDLRKREDPLRARLNTRLRYVLTHTPGLALWGGRSLVRSRSLEGSTRGARRRRARHGFLVGRGRPPSFVSWWSGS